MLALEDFPESGVVRLLGALTPVEVSAMRETIWKFIEARTSIRAREASTWPDRMPAGLSFRALQGRPVFAPLVNNHHLTDALKSIFGEDGWQPPKHRGRVLWTFPQPGPWVMPNGWHMDGDFGLAAFPVPAVQLWALLDDVAPSGGGTLLLAGSHHLVQRYAAYLPLEGRGGNGVTWGRFLKQDAWLNQLRREATAEQPRRELFNERREVDGVPIRLIEVQGAAGDIFVSHIQVFHSVAPNTGTSVRQMLTGAIASRHAAELPAP